MAFIFLIKRRPDCLCHNNNIVYSTYHPCPKQLFDPLKNRASILQVIKESVCSIILKNKQYKSLGQIMETQTMKNENCFPLVMLCRVHYLGRTTPPTSTPDAASPSNKRLCDLPLYPFTPGHRLLVESLPVSVARHNCN